MSAPDGGPSRLVTGLVAVELLAIASWLGGLVVLGAVVAPTVFRIVAAPHSADAMTVVFGRFDTVAMAGAVVSLVVEAVLLTRGRLHAVDLARLGLVVVASGLAVVEGVVLGPGIATLHRGGAVRGHDAAGLELERLHKLAEAAGKAEVFLLVAVVVLLAVRLSRRPTAHRLH